MFEWNMQHFILLLRVLYNLDLTDYLFLGFSSSDFWPGFDRQLPKAWGVK